MNEMKIERIRRHAAKSAKSLVALGAAGVALAVASATASAQTQAPSSTPSVPPSTTTTTPTANPIDSTSSTQTGGGSIASVLNQQRAAVPLPNPNLANSAAYPLQRGFVRAEPFFIYPYVGIGLGHNDNLIGTKDNRISSNVITLTPRISADLKYGAHTHSVVYQGNYGRYTSSHADDYNDHELIGRTVNQFDARNDLTASVYYLNKVDPRGLLTRPSSDRPDRWHAIGANGTYGYGARSAQGRVEVDAGFTDKTYDNNRTITGAFDVSSLNLAGRFLYRVAPRTRLLTELRFTTFDYKNNTIDSDETRLLVGATWDLAAATSGTIKLGSVRKNFKDSSLKDFNGFTVETAVRWLPRTYSQVDLLLARMPADTTGVGTFTVDTSLGAVWTHRWQSYFSTRAMATYLNSDFQGLSRTDKTSSVSLGAYFDVRTWLRLGAEYTAQHRASSVDALSFNRNILMFTVAGTL